MPLVQVMIMIRAIMMTLIVTSMQGFNSAWQTLNQSLKHHMENSQANLIMDHTILRCVVNSGIHMI